MYTYRFALSLVAIVMVGLLLTSNDLALRVTGTALVSFFTMYVFVKAATGNSLRGVLSETIMGTWKLISLDALKRRIDSAKEAALLLPVATPELYGAFADKSSARIYATQHVLDRSPALLEHATLAEKVYIKEPTLILDGHVYVHVDDEWVRWNDEYRVKVAKRAYNALKTGKELDEKESISWGFNPFR